MDLNVFACRDGFLLSAACMLLPKRASDTYWPVSVLGIVDCRDLPDDLRQLVLMDVEEKQFAFVTSGEANRCGLPSLATKRPYKDGSTLRPHLLDKN